MCEPSLGAGDLATNSCMRLYEALPFLTPLSRRAEYSPIPRTGGANCSTTCSHGGLEWGLVAPCEQAGEQAGEQAVQACMAALGTVGPEGAR